MRHGIDWSGREEPTTIPRFLVQMIGKTSTPLTQIQNTGAASFGMGEREK